MGFFYSIFGFLIAIGVLVAVHEFGHFWVARKLGVKVLRYSVGFGKPLWKRVSGVDQTEYVIAAIPLGGYVKMLGEGSDQDPVDPAERHRAFDAQPIWKRSLIVAAGPGINFLFAILLFMILGLGTQQAVIPTFGELPADSALAQAGVSSGDTLLSVDGTPVKHLLERDLYIFNQVLKAEEVQLQIQQPAGKKTITLQTSDIPIYNINPASLMRQLGFVRLAPPTSTEIETVMSGSPAELAGIQPGDRFVRIADKPIDTWSDLSRAVIPAVEQNLRITLDRDGVEYSVNVTPETITADNGEKAGRLGVGRVFIPYPEEQIVTISRSPLEALSYGVEKTWLMSSLTMRMLWKMVTLQVSHKNVNGPITIADVTGQAIQIGWETYVYVLAVISISLGVMNLLPIPMLDGGHLLMYVVEIVAGKNVSEKFFAIGQRVGVLLLIGLMSLAFYNDIFRLLN